MVTKTEVTSLLREYQDKDHRRLELAEEVKKLDQAQKAILDQLTALGIESGKYGPYLLTVDSKKVPRCTDWNTFHQYLIQTGNLDMLHKRLTDTAVMARMNEGEYVPGIVVDEKPTFKIKAA